MRYSLFFNCRKSSYFDDDKLIRAPPSDSLFEKNNKMENQKMKDIKYIIADNVKIYRKKKSLTQMELAERADLSVESIKRIENGKRTMSLDNFLRLSNALDISLPLLLYEQGDEITETERIHQILKEKSREQKEYLLHMLEQMSKGLDKLL